MTCASVVLAQTEVAPGVMLLGKTENEAIVEASGLIPSHRARNVFWTHNDSGVDMLYAIGADGRSLGQWKIKNVDLQNWEDLARTAGRLYIADIGNNDHSRDRVAAYAIPEPRPGFSGEIRPNRVWQLKYPDGDKFDAESLVIARGFGYIISKELSGGEARVYRFPLRGRRAAVELQPQCKLDVDAPPAGADLTADLRRLGVITREGAYLFSFPNRRIPAEGKVDPTLFVPFSFDRMEGCCFTRHGLLAIAETGELFLFTDPQFQTGRRRVAKRR